MQTKTTLTLMSVYRGTTKKSGEPYVRLSTYLDNKVCDFFLMQEKIKLAEGLDDMKLKPFDATLDFYPDSKGGWRCQLQSLKPIKN